MNFDILTPTVGRVTLELSWDEAEVLTRLVGLANSGTLREFAPDLLEFVQTMVSNVGRNRNEEANKYVAKIIGNQVYLERKYKDA